MKELVFSWRSESGVGEKVYRECEDRQELFIMKSSQQNFDENRVQINEQNTVSYSSFSEYWSDFINNPTWFRCKSIDYHPDLNDVIRENLTKIQLDDFSTEDQDYLLDWLDLVEISSSMMMKERLVKLIGTSPKNDSDFKRKRRFHQGWWRTFVLALDQGTYLGRGKVNRVCNRINMGKEENFLSENIYKAMQLTIDERKDSQTGIMEVDRLANNLLSSQPLAFNFFGEFKINKELATKFFQSIFPDIIEVEDVFFEYPHKENYIHDHSAFDVAIIVRTKEKIGLIGLECKYTDTFSHRPSNTKINYGDTKNKNHDIYKRTFDNSTDHFLNDYYEYVRNNEINQLFRNELIGQSLIQHSEFDFVITGLFCDQEDSKGINSGKKLQGMIKDGQNKFKILTYDKFIETFQKLDLSPQERQLSMMLWARYSGFLLSWRLFK